jgi:small ligand-binding sensory domain FIST
MTFRAAYAVGGASAAGADWQTILDRVLTQLAGDPRPRGPGFVYFSDVLQPHAAQIVAGLREATGVVDWVGSVGIGVLASGREFVDQPGLSVMVADWPAGEYQVFSGKSRAPSTDKRTASGAHAAHFAIVHGDAGTHDMPELLEDMSSKLASGFLVGGISSAREAAGVQIANDVLQGGLSGVVLSNAIGVVTRHTQGCTPMPGRYTVTSGERNIIAAIDGRPALDVFREAAGPELGTDLRRAAFSVLAGLPVAGSDTGDYLVRNVVGIDPKNKLIAIGAEVTVGMPLLFCRRDEAAAREDLSRMLEQITAGLNVPVRGALYFACVARGRHMFGADSVELGMIRDHLGDVPLAGFFANGEISHHRLYGYTGVLTLFT